ncbi:MAG TPA: DUF3887 domain-containing protein [Frateuria sp.]|uniref:DUF3887 domain-containing protein n=1 Tax=Frateuria sp. TaxID=2211372 RepID=UPI002D7E9ACE|nr:DUF3887 domain-containing protein [Frateuria sp.]HET6806421.1 DUF3887 domain-containing protein [Frateuria sp.]
MPRLPALLLACLACGAGHASSLAAPCAGKASRLSETLAAHDYRGANAQLGVTMRIMFSPEQLQSNWESLTAAYGAYRSHAEAAVASDDGKDVIVRVPLSFAKGTKTLQVACSADGNGDISSLAFL